MSTSTHVATQPILIDGRWRDSVADDTFQAVMPVNEKPLPGIYPVSSWADCDAALSAAAEAFVELRTMPGGQIANFLEAYANNIEARAGELVDIAHLETAYPMSPRLMEGELPRTVDQLRQAAAAAREGSWRRPVIDAANNIRSCLAPIGPVCVFGPNNFPFAFGSVSGGDFAAAIAAGNPVIGKGHPSHPGTTRIFADAALTAINTANMPPATVQMIYRTSHADGARLVSDPRVAATGYTGSRSAGLKLKQAADSAGKLIYLELSSVNPVVILPGALRQRQDEVVEQFVGSCLMGSGQFCTNPGLVILLAGASSESFIQAVADKFAAAPVGTLLAAGVESSLTAGIKTLQKVGCDLLLGGRSGAGDGYSVSNTLLRTSGEQFLADPETMQTEMFGNASLMVVAADARQAVEIVEHLEGNLTGCIYSDSDGGDDDTYDVIAPPLRHKVGRLINDKMPTGVAVSPAMNHGGPYPATGHPHFTAVGIPAAITRFTALHCYDNVRQERLPECLRD